MEDIVDGGGASSAFDDGYDGGSASSNFPNGIDGNGSDEEPGPANPVTSRGLAARVAIEGN